MVILIFILGLIIGSFLNCLVWRLHVGKTLGGRSQCTRCHKKIFWYDNIPVISFLVLKGRCRHCKKKISWQYPLVELATAILFTLAYLQITNYGLRITDYENFTAYGLRLTAYFVFISFL